MKESKIKKYSLVIFIYIILSAVFLLNWWSTAKKHYR